MDIVLCRMSEYGIEQKLNFNNKVLNILNSEKQKSLLNWGF